MAFQQHKQSQEKSLTESKALFVNLSTTQTPTVFLNKKS